MFYIPCDPALSSPVRDGRRSRAERSIFFDALAAANDDKTGSPRILIAGSADNSMYALARRAAPEEKITVLDRCDLPLYLCRRAAEENSDTIETIAGDIFDHAPRGDASVVCSDAFFCQVSLTRHGAMIDIWRRALRPGGQVVTTTRIDLDSPDDERVRTVAQIAAFRDRVLKKARPWWQFLDISLDDIADLAERHAGLIRLHNLRSKEELTEIFEEGGFRIDRLDLTERSRSGHAMSDRDRSVYYEEIVATKI